MKPWTAVKKRLTAFSAPWWAIATMALLVAATAFLLQGVADLGAAQRATGSTFSEVVNGHRDTLRTAALVDCVFVVTYVLFGFFVFSRFWVKDPEGRSARHPGAVAGMVIVAAAGAADLVENAFLGLALNRDQRLPDWWLGAMRTAGVAKWALLGASVAAFVILLVNRPREPYVLGHPGDRPKAPEGAPAPDWDPPEPDPDGKSPKRLGVCLSGGGIRSAAYSLGGLQALQDKGILARAEYLSAASGGGYLAAGWALSDAMSPAVAKDRSWSQGSPEERWLRDHSSYLVPDLLGGLKGVGRLLGGVLVNVLVIWMVLFLLARPVGWAMSAAHPELRALEPMALRRDTTAEMQIGAVRLDRAIEVVVDGEAVRAERFEVELVPDYGKRGTDPSPNEVCFDTEPFDPDDREHCFAVQQEAAWPAIVEVRVGRAEVVAQPKVALVKPCDPPPDPLPVRCRVVANLEIGAQPMVALKDDVVRDLLRPDQLELDKQAVVRSKSGLFGRAEPTYREWMWEGSLGLMGGGLLVAFSVMGGRLRGRRHALGRYASLALTLTGLACFAVTIALPALVTWLPRFAARIPGTDISFGDYLVPSGGLVAVAIAAARQYLSGDRKGAGTGPAKSEQNPTSLLAKVRNRLTKHDVQLTWYETSPTKIMLAVALALVFAVSLVAQLQFATANGPTGRLMGLVFVRDYLPDWMFWPEWAKFLVVTIGLALLAVTVDAHSWSLYSFYKRRLSSAFLLEKATGGRVKDIPYDKLLPFVPDPEGCWQGLPGSRERPDEGRPKLVLCCAVNLSEYGRVPPGRRAASFTFRVRLHRRAYRRIHERHRLLEVSA